MRTAFADCVADFAAARPGYPAGLPHLIAQRLGLGPGALIADVGAGTGLATRLFLDAGFRVVPVEPDDAMRAEGGRQLGIPFCAGTAESTGLVNASVDAVVAAQAFHWFDAPRALAEWRRVLRGGGLAVFWNDRDSRRSLIWAGLDVILPRYNPKHDPACRRRIAWGGILDDIGLFTPAEHAGLRHEIEFTADRFVKLVRSFSYVRVGVPSGRMESLERELRALVARHAGDGPCRLPCVVNLWTARVKSGGGCNKA